MYSQNYVESVVETFEYALRQELTERERQLTQEGLQAIQPLKDQPNDTILFYHLLYVGSSQSQPDLLVRFNDLTYEIAKDGVARYPAEKGRMYRAYLASAISNRGSLLLNAGQYYEAIEQFNEAITLLEQNRDSTNRAQILANIGIIYYNQGNLDKARQKIRQALKLDSPQATQAYYINTILAEIYLRTGAFPQADSVLLDVLQLPLDSLSQKLHVNAMRTLGKSKLLQGKTEEALNILKQQLEIAEKKSYTKILRPLYSTLAEAYLQKGELFESRRAAEKVLTLAKPINEITSLQAAYEVLYRIEKKKGNFQAALDYFEQGRVILDSITSGENQQRLLEQEYKFAYEKRALTDSLENASLLAEQIAENRQRRSVSYALLVGLLVSLILGGLLWKRFQITRQQNGVIEKEKHKLDLANRKLRELDNFKSQFFTNISHEFRTPLTVITGMTQQVRQEPDKWLDKGIKLIDRNAQSLLHLINQILDLRKLESGNLTLSPIQADVIQALRLSTASFESMAESKDIELEFASYEAELMMDFDPEKLGQIINNLLSNALKFTPEGGAIRISVGAARPAAPTTTPSLLQIEVVDTGKGIPAQKLPYIFDRFYQVDGTDTRQGEGTGVGLSLTKELVQLMRGEIQVESKEGKGTTFTVRLPIEQQASVEEVAASTALLAPILPETLPAPVTGEGDRPRLLIIEDNPDIVSYLYSLLEDQYELSSAPDGQQGIEAALEQVPDLIITDVMMPHKNGYEVTEALKLDERTSHIPIVMLTAKADQSSKLEGYKRGADAYLAKPFDKEELMIRLAKLWEIRQRLQKRYQQTSPPPTSTDPTEKMEDAFLSKVRAQILSKIDEAGYRGDALCEDLGLSRSNLYRKLKALTGLSIAHFIRSVRLDFAKGQMLQQPDLMVAEIAYASGFNDPAYFNRVFSEVNGLSPGEWREANVGK